MAGKKRGLGRGLDALFADAVPVNEDKEAEIQKKENIEEVSAEDRIVYLKIHDIMPNENQPRKTFDEEKIGELADSIKEHGIIQPIVVRKKKGTKLLRAKDDGEQL